MIINRPGEMRAIQMQQFGIKNLHLAALPKPVPRAGEVLVKMMAASLQHLDLVIIKGALMPDITLPHIPVSEGAGMVEKPGEGVVQWKAGDRVMIHFIQRWLSGRPVLSTNMIRTSLQSQGVLAEYVCVPEEALVRSPGNLTDEQTATCPVVALTAWRNLVTLAGLCAGQTLLIQGTGGVSLAALQIAKILGAKVIATSGSDDKMDKLKALGADEVINYIKYPEWSKEVMRVTGNRGVDVVLDMGGGKSIAESILSCAMGGYVGLIGFLNGGDSSFDVSSVIMKYIRLQGNSVGSRMDLEDLVKAIEINNIEPVIDSVYPIDEFRKAFERVEDPNQFGKVVIQIAHG
jgi:NADPH:quinone reductase-like Zn-dependent oxidoreductase